MAGRHARKAPVVISRALAMLVASALLLAVGVVAMTVLTGGERRATGGHRAGAPTVVTGPSGDVATTTGATPDAGQTHGPTPDSETGLAPGGRSSDAGGGGVDPAGAGRGGSTPINTSPAVPSAGGAAPQDLDVTSGASASARGWVQRSDAGRAHGRAVGPVGRVSTPHGCRPIPTKARPITVRTEPRACR